MSVLRLRFCVILYVFTSPLKAISRSSLFWHFEVNRMSAETRQQLLHGPALRPCRDALTHQHFPVEIQGGSLVFVHPYQYEDVLRRVKDKELIRADIIFSESFEDYVAESLDRARSAGAWMKSRDRLPEEKSEASGHKGDSRETSSIEELLDGIIEVDRTFLTWRPVSAGSNKKAKSH